VDREKFEYSAGVTVTRREKLLPPQVPIPLRICGNSRRSPGDSAESVANLAGSAATPAGSAVTPAELQGTVGRGARSPDSRRCVGLVPRRRGRGARRGEKLTSGPRHEQEDRDRAQDEREKEPGPRGAVSRAREPCGENRDREPQGGEDAVVDVHHATVARSVSSGSPVECSRFSSDAQRPSR